MFSPAISPADPNLMMLNCDMSAAYISEDGGHNWRMIHQAQLRTDTQCRPGFHPSDAKVICASSRGLLKISRDRGRTFAPIGDLKESLSGEIAINPSDPRIILAGRGDEAGGLYRTQDGGRTWQAFDGLPFSNIQRVTFDPSDDHLIYLATFSGNVWRGPAVPH